MRPLQTFLLRKTRSGHLVSSFVRFLCSRPANTINRVRICERLTLRTLERNTFSASTDSPGPLVLLFGWAGAKDSHLDKYCQLYHDRGLDVLTIDGRTLEFLWPEMAFPVATKVLDYLQQSPLVSAKNGEKKSPRYLVNALSLGGYCHSVCLMMAERNPERYGWYKENILGCVFDSLLVGTGENATRGFAMSVSNVPVIQSDLVKHLTELYKIIRPKLFDESVRHFKSQPLKVPTLYFYCKNDTFSDAQACDDLVKSWREKFHPNDLHIKSWERSVHVGHIQYHEKEYKAELDQFLRKLSL